MDRNTNRVQKEKQLEDKCENLLSGLQDAISKLSTLKAKYKHNPKPQYFQSSPPRNEKSFQGSEVNRPQFSLSPPSNINEEQSPTRVNMYYIQKSTPSQASEIRMFSQHSYSGEQKSYIPISHHNNSIGNYVQPIENPDEKHRRTISISKQDLSIDMIGFTLEQKEREAMQMREMMATLQTQVQQLQERDNLISNEMTRMEQECSQWKKKYFTAIKEGQAKQVQTKRDAEIANKQLIEEYESIIRSQASEFEQLQNKIYEYQSQLLRIRNQSGASGEERQTVMRLKVELKQNQDLVQQLLRKENEKKEHNNLEMIVSELELQLKQQQQDSISFQRVIHQKDQEIQSFRRHLDDLSSRPQGGAEHPDSEALMEELKDCQKNLKSIYADNEALGIKLIEYEKNKEQLSQLENLYTQETKKFNQQQAKIQILYEKVDNLETEKLGLESKVNKKRTKLKNLKKEIQQQTIDIGHIKEYNQKLSDVLERKRQKCKGRKQIVHDQQKSLQDLEDKILKKSERKKLLKIQMKDVTNTLKAEKTTNEDQKKTNDQLKQSIQNQQAISNQLDEKLFQAEAENQNLIEKLQKKKLKSKQIKKTLKEFQDLSTNIGTGDQLVKELERTIDSKEMYIKHQKSKLRSCQNSLKLVLKQISELKSERWKILSLIVDRRRKISAFAKDQLEETMMQLQELQKLGQVESQIQSSRSSISQDSDLIKSVKEENEILIASVQEASDQIQVLSGKMVKKKDKIKSYKLKLQKLDELEAINKSQEDKLIQRKEKLIEYKNKVKELELKIQTIVEHRDMQNYDDTTVLQTKLSNKGKKYRSLKQQFKELQETSKTDKETIEGLEAKVKTKKQSVKELKEKQQQLEDTIVMLSEQAEASQEELQNVQKQLKEEKDQSIRLEQQFKIESNQLKEQLNTQLHFQSQETEYFAIQLENLQKSLENEAGQHQKEIELLKNEKDVVEARCNSSVDQLQKELDKLQLVIETRNQEQEILNSQLLEENQSLKSMQVDMNQIEQLTKENQELKQRLNEAPSDVSEMLQEIIELKADYDKQLESQQKELAKQHEEKLNQLVSAQQQEKQQMKQQLDSAVQERKSLAKKFAINRFVLLERSVELNLSKSYGQFVQSSLHERNILCKNLAKSLEEKLLELQDKDEYYQLKIESLKAELEKQQFQHAVTKTRMSVVLPSTQNPYINKQIQNWQSEMKELKQQIEFKQQQNDRLIETSFQQESLLQSLQQSLSQSLRQSKLPSQRDIDVSEDRVQLKHCLQENLLLKAQIEQERASVIAKDALQHYQEMISALGFQCNEQVDHQQKDHGISQEEYDSALQKIDKLQKELDEAIKNRSDLQKTIQQLNNKVSLQRAENQEFNENIEKQKKDLQKSRNRITQLEEVAVQVGKLTTQAQKSQTQIEAGLMAYEDLYSRVIETQSLRRSESSRRPSVLPEQSLSKSQSLQNYNQGKDQSPQRISIMKTFLGFGKKSSTENTQKEKDFLQLEKDYQALMVDFKKSQQENVSLGFQVQTLRSIIENFEQTHDTIQVQSKLKEISEQSQRQQEQSQPFNLQIDNETECHPSDHAPLPPFQTSTAYKQLDIGNSLKLSLKKIFIKLTDNQRMSFEKSPQNSTIELKPSTSDQSYQEEASSILQQIGDIDQMEGHSLHLRSQINQSGDNYASNNQMKTQQQVKYLEVSNDTGNLSLQWLSFLNLKQAVSEDVFRSNNTSDDSCIYIKAQLLASRITEVIAKDDSQTQIQVLNKALEILSSEFKIQKYSGTQEVLKKEETDLLREIEQLKEKNEILEIAGSYGTSSIGESQTSDTCLDSEIKLISQWPRLTFSVVDVNQNDKLMILDHEIVYIINIRCIIMEIARPFIIRPNGRPRDYVVNPESDLFNATIEKRVQFVQGANTFVGIMLLYESIRYIYYYFQYRETCSDYAYLVIAYLAGNFLWVLASFYGFGSIDTRNTKKIRQFYNCLIFVLITRVFVYMMMAYVMDKYQNVFNRHTIPTSIGEMIEEVQDLVCTSVYQKGLILIQCVIETCFLVMMIVLSKQIRDYVRGWQQFENMKSINLPLVNRS